MMDFIELLLNYGVLGLWTAWLIYEKSGFEKKISVVIENNTNALIRVLECLEHQQPPKVG